jgi:hypothetical protein
MIGRMVSHYKITASLAKAGWAKCLPNPQLEVPVAQSGEAAVRQRTVLQFA